MDQVDFASSAQRERAEKVVERKTRIRATPCKISSLCTARTPESQPKRRTASQPRRILARSRTNDEESEEEEIWTPTHSPRTMTNYPRRHAAHRPRHPTEADQAQIAGGSSDLEGGSENDQILKAYQECICELLGVSERFTTSYSLEQLRFYCRRYLSIYWNEIVEDDDGTLGSKFINHCIVDPETEDLHGHLTLLSTYRDTYKDLAVAAGHMRYDRNEYVYPWAKDSEEVRQFWTVEQKEHNDKERRAKDNRTKIALMDTNVDPFTWKALGLIPNEFGMKFPLLLDTEEQ